MGESSSKFAHASPALCYQRLSQQEVQELLSSFGLNEFSPAKARISLHSFLRIFPPVLQPTAAVLLPVMRDLARMEQHLLLQGFSSSSMLLSNDNLTQQQQRGRTGAMHQLLFSNSSKASTISSSSTSSRLIAALGPANCAARSARKGEETRCAGTYILLQEMVDAVSACVHGEREEVQLHLLQRLLLRMSKLLAEQQRRLRHLNMSDGPGVKCCTPAYYQRRASTALRRHHHTQQPQQRSATATEARTATRGEAAVSIGRSTANSICQLAEGEKGPTFSACGRSSKNAADEGSGGEGGGGGGMGGDRDSVAKTCLREAFRAGAEGELHHHNTTLEQTTPQASAGRESTTSTGVGGVAKAPSVVVVEDRFSVSSSRGEEEEERRVYSPHSNKNSSSSSMKHSAVSTKAFSAASADVAPSPPLLLSGVEAVLQQVLVSAYLLFLFIISPQNFLFSNPCPFQHLPVLLHYSASRRSPPKDDDTSSHHSTPCNNSSSSRHTHHHIEEEAAAAAPMGPPASVGMAGVGGGVAGSQQQEHANACTRRSSSSTAKLQQKKREATTTTRRQHQQHRRSPYDSGAYLYRMSVDGGRAAAAMLDGRISARYVLPSQFTTAAAVTAVAGTGGTGGISNWDATSAATALVFFPAPSPLDFRFIFKAYREALAAATAATAAAASASASATAAASSAVVATRDPHHKPLFFIGGGGGNSSSSSSQPHAAISAAGARVSLLCKPTAATAATNTSTTATAEVTKQQLEEAAFWLLQLLPMLPALFVVAVPRILLGAEMDSFNRRLPPAAAIAALADGSGAASPPLPPPQLAYQVYAPRRRRTSLNSAAYGGGKGSICRPLSPEGHVDRSSSAESLARETGGWRGQGPLDGSSKIFTDEAAVMLRLSSSLFPFPPATAWRRLYASWKQGASLNRICNHVFFYNAPTILLIKTETGAVLGAVIASEWKDMGHSFFGDPNTFLFSLEPHFQIMRASGLGRNFVYMNSKNQFYPRGVGFGGQAGCFRLWLSEDFRECYCTRSDATYAPGPLTTRSSTAARSAAHALFKKNRNNSNLTTAKTAATAEAERGGGGLSDRSRSSSGATNTTPCRQLSTGLQSSSIEEESATAKAVETAIEPPQILQQQQQSASGGCSGDNDATEAKTIEENQSKDGENGGAAESFHIPFEVQEVEVWGCGDSHTLMKQRIAAKRQEQLRQERRQVDKGRFARNDFDREFLLENTFNQTKRSDA